MVRIPHRFLSLFVIATALFGVPRAGEAQLRVPASDTEGLTTPIVDPHGAMRHYYQRLRAVKQGQRVLARASVYGESTNAADRVTSALRRRLQARFGDGGKGFLVASPGWPYQRHQDVAWRHEGRWQTWVVNRRNGPLHRYGLGGVVSESRGSRTRAYFGTADRGTGSRVARYQIFYQAHPNGGDLAIGIDGEARETLTTRASAPTDRVHTVEVRDGSHVLDLGPAASEAVRVYGVAMEREGPGAVVDGLMLVGAFTRVLNHFDAEHWANQVAQRETDLLIFWLGGNDATSSTTGFAPDQYVTRYASAIVASRRARPQASCLVVSVIDSAESREGRIRTRPRVPRVVAAQARVATESRCAFFDLFEATGGPGTMARWRRQRLAEGDYKHLTRAGANEVGTTIYRAIAQGYNQFVGGG
ncbi:MAG: GDSL-type esterase/lipase family protein [Myxococcota bacterium]